MHKVAIIKPNGETLGYIPESFGYKNHELATDSAKAGLFEDERGVASAQYMMGRHTNAFWESEREYQRKASEKWRGYEIRKEAI